MERSRLSINTQLGFVGEEETPLLVTADMTELGECRIELRPSADFTGALPTSAAYLHPTDAAVLGHQLLEASRAAVAPPAEDES